MTTGAVSIVGFGKIGQALAAHLLSAGLTVHAIDRDPLIASLFRSGSFTSAEPGVQDLLREGFANGILEFDRAVTRAIIIAIPLSLDEQRRPDSHPFVSTVLSLASLLHEKMLLVIETSLPVGFCRNILVPALAIAGKEHGRDYLLAHSPERIKSGTMLQQLRSVPKIIAGFDGEAADAVQALYSMFFEKELLVPVNGIESAEMVKMAGMMYRDLNIALANQLAMYADAVGVDLVSLTPLINSDNEARMLQPGIGVGGHCTPVYPYFMIDSFRKAGMEFTLGAEARQLNEIMTSYAASLAVPSGSNPTVVVLGLAFRPGVREDAFSPAYGLVKVLTERGYQPLVHDPLYNREEILAKGFEPVHDLYSSKATIVFLVTMHEEYNGLDMAKLAAGGVVQIIDGRNRLSRKLVESAGMIYKGIGH